MIAKLLGPYLPEQPATDQKESQWSKVVAVVEEEVDNKSGLVSRPNDQILSLILKLLFLCLIIIADRR